MERSSELEEDEEKTHPRDVWIENRKQHGFQSKPIPLRWPLRRESYRRKDTWSDEFSVGSKSVFRDGGNA